MKCLDTSFCVDFLRGNSEAVELVKHLDKAGEQLVLPGPVLVELLPGPFSRGGPALAQSLAFVANLEVVPVTAEIALDAARLGGDCLRAGHPQDPIDLLIASTSRSLGCAVISRDKDFASMPGVMLATY